MCLRVSIRKNMNFFFGNLEVTEGSGSGVGFRSGSITHWYGSVDPHPDPDPHQNGSETLLFRRGQKGRVGGGGA